MCLHCRRKKPTLKDLQHSNLSPGENNNGPANLGRDILSLSAGDTDAKRLSVNKVASTVKESTPSEGSSVNSVQPNSISINPLNDLHLTSKQLDISAFFSSLMFF